MSEPKTVIEMKEEELRDSEVPWPETLDELMGYIHQLVERPHDYGTCVYAMSMAATAAFQHVSKKLGVTVFQASCADLDVLRKEARRRLSEEDGSGMHPTVRAHMESLAAD